MFMLIIFGMICLFVLFILAIIGLFFYSLIKFIDGKKANKWKPGTISDESMTKRKAMLVASSVILGIVLVGVIGVILLFNNAIAYM